MKKSILFSAAAFAYCILQTANCFPQGTAINKTGAAAHNSALLDLSDTTKGILIPRMKKTNKLAITSPATGLMVYQTDDTTGFWYYNGVKWMQAMGQGGSSGSGCPVGYTSVNSQFCIETGENAAGSVSWYSASYTCVSAGARLCTWSEWYSACELLPGLLNTKDSFSEWISDASGSSNNKAITVGNTSNCSYNSIETVTDFRRFRCCYSKQ